MSQLHIIWDLDGTLINSEEEVLEALIKSVKEAGLSEKDQIASFRVGPTIDKILETTFSKETLTSEIKSAIIKKFRNNYDNCGFNRTPAYDGINEILNNNNYTHHIVTNKPDIATNRIIEKLKWKNYFADIVTPYTYMKSSGDEKMAKTELFASIIAHYRDERFVGVGDMATDAKAAVDNKIPAIGVLWGTGTRNELEKSGCGFICENILELKQCLERIKLNRY